MTSGKMKHFLEFFGVKENSMSPFCKTFENANDLRDAFMSFCPASLQQQKQDEASADREEQLMM
jgi:hypothetical protein